MGLIFGYVYDETGRYVEMTGLYEGPIYKEVQKDEIIEMVQIGYGVHDMPPNCTLEVCPDLIYDPVFKDGKWIKLKPELPPQPEPGPSEIDKLKAELEVTKVAMAESIMQQTLKGMGM